MKTAGAIRSRETGYQLPRGCGSRKETSDLDNLMTDGGFESHPPR
jgi:hypothetical protein